MYRALGSGEADVISAFSSDGRIAADDLVVLADPKGALPPYDAVLLIAPGRAEDARLREALAGLDGAITVEAMQKANFSVDRDRRRAKVSLTRRGGEGAGGGAERASLLNRSSRRIRGTQMAPVWLTPGALGAGELFTSHPRALLDLGPERRSPTQYFSDERSLGV
jgi:hypothetical protein